MAANPGVRRVYGPQPVSREGGSATRRASSARQWCSATVAIRELVGGVRAASHALLASLTELGNNVARFRLLSGDGMGYCSSRIASAYRPEWRAPSAAA